MSSIFRRILKGLALLPALVAPVVVLAQAAGGGIQTGLGPIGTSILALSDFIGRYLVPAVFAIALLVFLWGLFTYLIRGGSSNEGQESGKALMLWGIIGFVVMVCVWGIVNLLVSGLGLGGQGLQNVPTVPAAGTGAGAGPTGGGVSPDCGAAC